MSQTQNGVAQDTKPPTLANAYLKRTGNQPVFGVKRPLWRDDDNHTTLFSEQNAALRTEILQRDNYTCRFCGFKASKFQEFHHWDHDHENCSKDNLVTVCNLCHQVNHLGACAMGSRGVLVSNQELTQTEINNIARAIYVNELLGNKDVCEKLMSLIASFNFRGSDTLKLVFSGEIITVLEIATILADKANFPDELYAKRSEILAPLKLFPSKNSFKDGQLEFYAANNRALFLPENWAALTRQLVK